MEAIKESLRQKFIDNTGNNLWCEDFANSASFSDEYVHYLEELIITHLSEQLTKIGVQVDILKEK